MRKTVIWLWVLPLLAQQGGIFHAVEKERAIGEQLAVRVRLESQPVDDPRVGAYVARIGRELQVQMVGPAQEYEASVIAGGHWTEPFPLPGGFLFVPVRAFLAVEDEPEFAGMLAHAIGHAALRHGSRAAVSTDATASIPLVWMGGVDGPHADIRRPFAFSPAGWVEIQRRQELEADWFAAELMSKAGYPPVAFLRYVERTQPAGTARSPLPPRGIRIARLAEVVRSLPAGIPREDEEFGRVRELVRPFLPPRAAPTLR